jgi:hypothetical protein
VKLWPKLAVPVVVKVVINVGVYISTTCMVVVDKVALGQAFSECFSFPFLISFHELLHIH